MPHKSSLPGTHFLLLAVTVFAAFLLNLGGAPLFDLDEGAFSQATREMFLRGDFISPYVNGEPRYDKPVLIHWFQAASVALFGTNEFAFRLPSALAASGWVLLLYGFLRRVHADPRIALYGAMMTATALQISVIGKAATADALLNLWLAASLFGIYLYWLEDRRRYVIATFVFMGLGFLTKGPIAVLVPVAVSLLFFALQGEWRRWLRAVFDPLGIGLFLLINAPWYWLQYQQEGQAFIDGFFFKHNVSRFSDPMEGHAGSLFYYLLIAPIALLPFSTVLFKALGRANRLRRDPLGLYALIWFGFVLAFFSFSGTKLPHYLNYGLSGAIILMALSLDALRSRFWALLPALLWFTLLLALPWLLQAALPHIDDARALALLEGYQVHFGWGYGLFMAALVLGTLVLMFMRRPALPHAVLVSGLASVLAVSLWLLPALGQIQQGPVKNAGLMARDLEGPFVMWKVNMPSISVYSEQIFQRRTPQAGDLVFTRRDKLQRLGEYELLHDQGGLVLARVRSR